MNIFWKPDFFHMSGKKYRLICSEINKIIISIKIRHMGCCFAKSDVQIPVKKPNNDEKPINPPSPPQKPRNFKQQGKKYFHAKNYKLAIDAYQKALNHDPRQIVNYTNLALAYKLDKQYQKSIQVINQMMTQPSVQMPADEDLVYIVKGKILKARSQTILVKQFCICEHSDESDEEFEQMKKTIQESKEILKDILNDSRTKDSAKKMGAEQYLATTEKIQAYLLTRRKRSQKNNQILEYFEKRLKTQEATRSLQKISEYFQSREEIMEYLVEIVQENNKQSLQDEEQQQDYLVDPVTYERFENPIIVRSGLTYEQSTLKMHFGRNGTNDPITHQVYASPQDLGRKNRALYDYISERRKPIPLSDLNYLSY